MIAKAAADAAAAPPRFEMPSSVRTQDYSQRADLEIAIRFTKLPPVVEPGGARFALPEHRSDRPSARSAA